MKYRVFHTGENRTIAVSSVSQVFPEAGLTCQVAGVGLITIWSAGGTVQVLGPIPFGRLAREDGTGFATALDCKTYLDQEFSKKYLADEINWKTTEW